MNIGLNSILMGALAVAASLSGWMYFSGRGDMGLPGCGKGSGCDAVAQGRWSLWGPIRVSVFGVILYSLMLGLVLFRRFCPANLPVQTSNNVLEVLAIIAAGAAIWFVGLQLLIIRRLCFYCILIHMCGILAAALVLKDGLQSDALTGFLKLMFATICLALLIGGQILFKPVTYAVVESPLPVGVPNNLTFAKPPELVPPSTRLLSQRHLSWRSGRVTVNLDDFPYVGPSGAKHIIGYLFDYTCEECHHLNRLLLDAVTHYAGHLAVVAIPVPMHPSCNPTVTCTDQARAFSCAFARLHWAMWTIDMDRYTDWVRFMTDESQVKPFGLALLRAQELADIRRFKIREKDDELDLRIASGVSIFRAAGEPKLPALLLPAGILLGHVPDLNGLVGLLDKHLDLGRD